MNIDILKKDVSLLQNVKTIILSPHSAVYETRKEITSLGYKIVDEIFTYDQNKPYNIIKFIKGQEKYTEDELYFGPIILKNKNEYFYKYYNDLKNKETKILETIPKENIDIRNKIIKEIERLDRNI